MGGVRRAMVSSLLFCEAAIGGDHTLEALQHYGLDWIFVGEFTLYRADLQSYLDNTIDLRNQNT